MGGVDGVTTTVKFTRREVTEHRVCIQARRRRRLDLHSRHELLGNHASDTDHGESAVVQFLGRDILEVLVIRRLEPKRVEAEVARELRGKQG